MKMMTLRRKPCSLFKKQDQRAVIPVKATKYSAGYDLAPCESMQLLPGHTRSINTGITLTLPRNTFGYIAEKSSVALHTDLMVRRNVINQNYTGRIKIIVRNCGQETVTIDRGTYLAQLIIVPYQANVTTMDKIPRDEDKDDEMTTACNA